jgi:hypothetical protein
MYKYKFCTRLINFILDKSYRLLPPPTKTPARQPFGGGEKIAARPLQCTATSLQWRLPWQQGNLKKEITFYWYGGDP